MLLHSLSLSSFCLWSTLVAQTLRFLRFLNTTIESDSENRREGIGQNKGTVYVLESGLSYRH